MESDHSINTANLKLAILKSTVIGVLVITAGVAGMAALARMKTPPAGIESKERPLYVEVISVMPEDVSVSITGYGEVRSLNEVAMSPEVSGNIVTLHPGLEVGAIVDASELLFKIDDRNYAARYKEAQAAVSQWENAIIRMNKQFEIDKERLKTIERNRSLAEVEFKRIQRLFESDKVGTRAGVDKAEQAFNVATDQADQMAQAVSLYPIRIKEAESSLVSAQARFLLAEANLNRCNVRAPFHGRIKKVSVEKGQYVAPGQIVIILADDSILEIQVPLDSRDAQKWLRFNHHGGNEDIAWFSGLDPVQCQIHWTEMKDGNGWKGQLHRVVKFDSQTRTLTVAIQIKAEEVWSGNGESIPLVDGMFCSVHIPGKTMKQVIELPRHVVSFDGTVYICRGNRLKTVPVEVVRSDGDMVYVSKGLKSGDLVITTRLVDPLENSLLKIDNMRES